MTNTTVYAEIVKAERNADGDLVVVGKATGPDLDLDQQICDPEWLGKAMPEWFSTGANIREMHAPIAAGVGTELAQSGDSWMVTSTVIDASSAKKVEAGVLKGYSIGISNPKVIKDAKAPGGRICGGSIVEVSLVDRPCNPTAMLMLSKAAKPGMTVKAVDFDRAHNLVKVEEYVEIPDATEAVDKVTEPEPEPEYVEKPDAPEAVDAKALVAEFKAAHPDTVKATPAEDIAGAQAAIAAIAQLIVSEAGDLATGDLGEACDIQDLLCAIDALRWFICGEADEAADDAVEPDADDVDVLITIPLSAEPDSTKTPAADVEKTPTAGDLTELVAAEVRKATEAHEGELKALRADMAKVLATPVPGGPAITRQSDGGFAAQEITKATEAQRYLRLADTVSDREMAKYYRTKAAQLTAAQASEGATS